ncbi:MAG: hypothetical protein AAF914_00105 [Pseudomonadota bacterium]
MTPRFLFLQNTVGVPPGLQRCAGAAEITVIDQYDFTPDALTDHQGLLISQHIDELHLRDIRDELDAFLARGGAIAVMGPVAMPYLTQLSPHQTEGTGPAKDWVLEMAGAHPVMAGVTADDISYRKGVVGFWARGRIAPIEGAAVVTRFSASGAPADWAWEAASGGKLFVHPGNDVWGYAAETTSAARVFPQMLAWMAA